MAAGNVKGIIIEIEGNTKGLSKSLNDVNKALKSTQDSLKVVNKALKLDPKNLDTLKTKQNLLNTAINETKQKLDIEREAAEKAAQALEEGTITQNQYDALQAEVAATAAELNNLEQEAEQTSAALDNLGNNSGIKNLSADLEAAGQKMQAVGDKVKNVGDNMQQLGGNLTKSVTAPVIGFGKKSLDAFNEVDGAMDTVIKKTGATGAAAEAYGNIVKDLATQIPTDFDTAAEAVGEVATRFDLTGQDLEELSGEFIKFAALNDTDVSSSIDKVQAAMAAYGVETDSAADVLDILTKASQDTGVSVDQLASDLTTNSATMQELGFGINRSVGFLASLNKQGIDSTAVMGGLKKALVNATKDGKTMDQALAELEQTMAGASSDTEAMAYAMELFGNKAGPQMAKAIQEGRLSFDEITNSVTGFGGAVDTTFSETLDPIDSMQTTLNELKLALAEVGASIGESLAPILQSLAEGLKNVAAWWKSLNPETQQFIIKAALIAATVGPVLIILGSLISAIGSIITVIGGAVGAIGGLIGAGGLAGIGTVITGTVLPAIGAAVTAAAPVVAVIAGIVAAIAAVTGQTAPDNISDGICINFRIRVNGNSLKKKSELSSFF